MAIVRFRMPLRFKISGLGVSDSLHEWLEPDQLPVVQPERHFSNMSDQLLEILRPLIDLAQLSDHHVHELSDQSRPGPRMQQVVAERASAQIPDQHSHKAVKQPRVAE